MRGLPLVMLAVCLCGVAARADEPKRPSIEVTTLRLMREHGVISEAEYKSAIASIGPSTATPDDSVSLAVGKWSLTLYGFVEADFLFDTTQSFAPQASNNLVARPSTYQGQHGRFTAAVSNSRFGFLIRTPESRGVRASAMFELDFNGFLPSNAPEAVVFTSPETRIRHLNLRLETPIVDILIGQFWHVFGWQNFYHINTVEVQGAPGQIYSRTPQIRLSKTVRARSFTFEAAAALLRSPQRDSFTPEGQMGVRFAWEGWTATQTIGPVGTRISPLSLAVTADVRRFSIPGLTGSPPTPLRQLGWGVAVNAFVPILRGTKDKRGNSLSIVGEYVYGVGIADLYAQLNGGVTTVAPTPGYVADVDPGMIAIAADNTAHLIKWQSGLVGVQYYVPRLGERLFVSSNYIHLWSDNTQDFAPPTSARRSLDWVDVNLWGEPVAAIRLGLEYAWFRDQYADGVVATNHRIQFSGFFVF